MLLPFRPVKYLSKIETGLRLKLEQLGLLRLSAENNLAHGMKSLLTLEAFASAVNAKGFPHPPFRSCFGGWNQTVTRKGRGLFVFTLDEHGQGVGT